MRIGVVSQWYDPEEGSASVPGAISRALLKRGHEVHVLTGFPNYPHGKVYPGYRVRAYQYERLDGVHVHRAPLIPSHDRSAARRAANYLSFAAAASAAILKLPRMDAWLVYSTPATVAIPALVGRAVRGVPFVILIQDLWPDTVVQSGFVEVGRGLRVMERALSAYCNHTYRKASAIAVTAPGMRDVLIQRGVPSAKLHFLPNWVDETVFRPTAPDRTLAADDPSAYVVMYAGNLGDLQGLDVVLEAWQRLGDLTGARLVFVGSGIGETRLRARATELGLRGVSFLGQLPLRRMGGILAAGDVQLICLRDLPLFRSILPSKVQASLAAGRPIVASVPGDAARVVEESGAGIAVPPEDPAALAGALRDLHAVGAVGRSALGDRAARYYQEHFSEEVGTSTLEALLVRSIAVVGASR